MMATLDFTRAWSVPVPVEVLGAHLQAYVHLQPTINALRLCNRYGRGPKAKIAKLPTELIGEIEGYVVEHERERQRDQWEKDFNCFQGLCKPIEHMSDSEQVDMWLDLFADCDCCGGHGFMEFSANEKLDVGQRKSIESFLQDVMDDEGPEESGWWMEHENRSTRWKGKTGAPPDQDRGLLSKYSALLLRNFGLKLWVTHTQPKKAKVGQFSAVDVYSSTAAYLILPSGKARATFDRAFSETLSYSDGTPFLATESGGGFPVALPRELSHQDISRFSRALKVLDLTPCDSDDAKPTLFAATKDNEDHARETGEVAVESDDGEKWTPNLRVLYSQAVDDEY